MAATYSSFMTTRFYSPVFNTALFDGPIRLYFSQSYETVALKIYHLLQTDFTSTWNALKDHTSNSKEHLFLIIYPELKDLHLVFTDDKTSLQTQEWEEGLAVGLCQTLDADAYMLAAILHDQNRNDVRIIGSNWIYDAIQLAGHGLIARICQGPQAVAPAALLGLDQPARQPGRRCSIAAAHQRRVGKRRCDQEAAGVRALPPERSAKDAADVRARTRAAPVRRTSSKRRWQ